MSRDSVADFVDGDPRAAALLRQSLTTLRDRMATDPGSAALRRDLDAVLNGRLDLRDLAEVPAFRALAEDGMRAVEAEWQALDPEDRARQVAAGREPLEASRPRPSRARPAPAASRR